MLDHSSTSGQLWVGDELSLALGSPVFITQQWVKGEHSIEISTFPLDVPTEVWTPQWKPMVIAIFSSPSFFLSQARNKLLAQLSKVGLGRCWNQADFCPLLIQEKKKKKSTSTGQLKERVSTMGFYWVINVCKTCSSLHQDYLPSSHHRAVKGEPNKKMRKLKHSKIKCHIASAVWIRNPCTPESTVFFHLN